MREPRYRFTDGVRAATRAIALRMVHAGEVAGSAAQLEEWIARTDDLRETLTKAGYGSAFTAEDLFPLFQSFVAKAPRAAAPRAEARSPRWLWIGILVTLALAIAVSLTVALR